MAKPVLTPRAAVAAMRTRTAAGQQVGVMFGPERAGLVNEDLAIADAVLSVPLNPAFASLNLGQAVLLLGYEWYQSVDRTPDRMLMDESRSEEHTSELQSLMRTSYAVFCLKKKTTTQ